MQIDGSDDAHVALTPFAAAVRDLRFEELQDVQAEHWIWDAEDAAEDLRGFVRYKLEDAVGFGTCDLLQDAEEVDRGLELTEGEVCDRCCWQGSKGIAELIDRWMW